MTNDEIKKYIAEARAAKMSDDKIFANLKEKGWQENDIKEAFGAMGQGFSDASAGKSSGLYGPIELLSGAWDVFRAKMSTFLLISIIPGIAMLLMGLFFGGMMALNLKSGVLSKAFSPGIFLSSKFLVPMILFFLVVMVVSVFSQVALVLAAKDRGARRVVEYFKTAKDKIIPSLITGALFGLAMFGGLILLIIPGLIFGVWFSMWVFIVVFENLKGADALKRSKYYVSDYLLPVAWRGIAIMLLFFVASWIFAMISAPFGKNIPDLVGSVLNLFFQPILVIYGYLLYENLKQLKGENNK